MSTHRTNFNFVSPIRFVVGEQFLLEDHFYTLERRMGFRLEFRRIDTGDILQKTLGAIQSQWASGKAIKVGNAPFDPDYDDYRELTADSFMALPERERSIALAKMPFMLAMDRLYAKGWSSNREKLAKLSRVVAIVFGWSGGPSRCPGASTLYKWYYEKWIPSGRLVASLAPRFSDRGNRTDSRSDARPFLEANIKKEYLRKNGETGLGIFKRTNADLHSHNKNNPGDQIKQISQSMVYRALNKLDKYEATRIRVNEATARKKYGVCGIMDRPTALNQEWEIDHTPMDLLVLDDTGMPLGIPNFTMAREGLTKMIMGFACTFTPPSCLSLGKCLVHAISPKDYLRDAFPKVVHDWPAQGIPGLVKVDNGPEFHSRMLEQAAFSVNSIIRYCPARQPWLKGMIEQAFRSLHIRLTRILPGTTLANFLERDGYNPTKFAIITWSELMSLLHKFIVDIWIRETHRTTMRSPYDFWGDSNPEENITLPPSLDFLRFTFAKRTTAQLHHYGVQYKYLFYRSSELDDARHNYQGKVELCVDQDDLSSISVVFPNGLRVIAHCTAREYSQGLTEFVHLAIIRLLRETDRDPKRQADLNEGYSEFFQMIDEAAAKRKGWGNKTLARSAGVFSSWRVTNNHFSPIPNEVANPQSPSAPRRPVPKPKQKPPKTTEPPSSYGMHSEGGWGVESMGRS